MKAQIPSARKPGKSQQPKQPSQSSKKEVTNESIGLDKSNDKPQPKKQNCLIEIVELANSLKDEDLVSGLVFKQIIVSIEAKLTEFQERLDNRDNLTELNTHLSKLQYLQGSPCSPDATNKVAQKREDTNNDTSGLLRNQSQISLPQNDNCSVMSAQEKIKSPQGRRSVSKQNSIMMGQQVQENNKLAAFEKRLRTNEDNQIKLQREITEQQNSFNQKLEKTLKVLNEKFMAYSTMNLQQQFNDITESQKAIIQHVQEMSKEMNETNNNLYKYKESQNVVAMELHNKVDQGMQLQNENFVRIQSLSSSLQAIDADLIVILKIYKDLLNDIFKIDLLDQQQKKIISILQDEQ